MIKKIFTSVVIVSFIFYGYVLCRLLFCGFYGVSMMFSEHLMIRQGYNLVPFKTIAEYITAFLDGRMRGVAFRNLAGNLFLLTPLGFYLPFFAKKTKKVISYMLVIAVLSVIACIPKKEECNFHAKMQYLCPSQTLYLIKHTLLTLFTFGMIWI